MKYELQVRMQQRHLKAIVGSAAQALPWGARSAAQALPSGHGGGLLAEGQALPSGHGSGLVGKRCLQDTGADCWRKG